MDKEDKMNTEKKEKEEEEEEAEAVTRLLTEAEGWGEERLRAERYRLIEVSRPSWIAKDVVLAFQGRK